tara:strand:+ start:2148 stop:2672 length:525 start_codon:yes stop_codon:yes gene_type:complete
MNNNNILQKIKIKQYKKPYISKRWIKWLNDKEITKFSNQRFLVHSLKTQRTYINNLRKNNTVFFKIYLEAQEIGNIFLTDIDKINKNCGIGYLIGKKLLWNKGIATFAVKFIIKYAFIKLKMKKIYTWCYSNNNGSKKVLMKNNFKIEGVIKKFYQFNHTKRVDKVYFGLYQDK